MIGEPLSLCLMTSFFAEYFIFSFFLIDFPFYKITYKANIRWNKLRAIDTTKDKKKYDNKKISHQSYFHSSFSKIILSTHLKK